MDKQRFKDQIFPLKHRLFRLACTMLGDDAEAQDAVQEIFIRLWNNRDTIGEIRNTEAYAVTMTKNHCTDRLRKRRSFAVDSIAENPDGQMNPEEVAEMTDSARLIRRLMQELPPQQRMVMHLRDIEGFEYAEIEIQTGLSNEAIRANLSRARKKIRTLFNDLSTYGLEKR